MKKGIIFFVLIFLVLFQMSLLQAREKEEVLALFNQLEQVIISVSNTIKPAVVHIEVVKKVGGR